MLVTLEGETNGGVYMESVLGLVRHPGNDGLFRAIEMSMLATLSGQPFHLHAEGLRGTGKTTIMRAVRRTLPRIRRIKQCLYNCDPVHPHCPQHRHLSPEEVTRLGDEWVPMPFLEISHSAKVGTVVGSIDLGRLVSPTQPEAALLPGTIPQAHRGIIFIDEINRLAETAPELADIMLDVMGTKPGRVQIEETGLPAVELPVQVSVWAASNPDEDPGPLEDIRRQLSDRFDFVVYTDRPGDSAVVERILSGNYGTGWHRPLSPADETQAELFRTQLANRMTSLRGVQVPAELRQHIADLYSRFNVESLRAAQAMQLGMRLIACLESRDAATPEDLARVVPLALRHRVDQETLKKVSAHMSGMNPQGDGAAQSALPVSRPRFPSISFGGMVAEQLAQPPAQQGGAPSARPEGLGAHRNPAAQDLSGARREWPTQYPPRPQAAAPQAGQAAKPGQGQQQQSGQGKDSSESGWLNRTLAGLRKNLGIEQAPPASRPERLTGRPGGRSEGREGGSSPLTAPRQGRLFQQAGQGADQGGSGPAGRSGPGVARAGNEQARPGESTVDKPDPLKCPPTAPAQAARPISQLDPRELIRSEEELGRR